MCLLTGVFRSFIFTVVVDMVHCKCVILLFVLCPICSLFPVSLFLPSFVYLYTVSPMVSRPFKHPGCHCVLPSIF